MEWRSGVEKDLGEVMQIDNVFLNVSKGQAANKDDLQKCFKTDDLNVIILEILKKGELQIGERERSNMLEGMYRDIATIVAEKCVNPETKRPYTVTMIEKAMADLHLSVNPSRSAKSQALDVIKQLLEKGTIPIARAQMRIRIVVSSKDGKKLKDRLMAMVASKEDEDLGENYEWTFLIDPGQFRPINELLESETKGKGQLEMLSLTETRQGDEVF